MLPEAELGGRWAGCQEGAAEVSSGLREAGLHAEGEEVETCSWDGDGKPEEALGELGPPARAGLSVTRAQGGGSPGV